MTAQGQKATFTGRTNSSALPPKGDFSGLRSYVCFGPTGDIRDLDYSTEIMVSFRLLLRPSIPNQCFQS